MFSKNTEELAQNKLILLYIIDKFTNNLNKDELTEFILEKNYLNFFSIQQYLKELTESQFIEVNIIEDDKKYFVTHKGKQALDYLDSKIPLKIKEDLSLKTQISKIEEEVEAQVIAEYFKKEDDQYLVNLKLVENETTLFSLYIDVPTEDQAKLFCSSWKKETDSIYSNIINLFIE